MAKIDKLMKSFEAFINNDTKAATQMYREFFIESAQEINKNLEEELDESMGAEDQLDEQFGGDMGDDLEDDIAIDDFEEEDTGFADEEEEDEFADDEGAPTAEEWADIQDAFDELEALFDELGGGDEADIDFEADESDDSFGEDEIEFGEDEDEDLREAFQMKQVRDPNMKREEQGVATHSIVSKKAKSPMGVKGTDGWSREGNVTGSNTELDTSSAETPKVDDQNNVMDSGKAAYKRHAEPNMKSEEAGVEDTSLIKPLR